MRFVPDQLSRVYESLQPIMSQHIMPFHLAAFQPIAADSQQQHMLIICDRSRWLTQGRTLPKVKNCWYIEIQALTKRIIADLNPDIVLSPLVGIGFDVLDVAERLAEIAYTGPYRAITGAIPNPELICKEVRAAVPHLDFDLVVLPQMAIAS